MLSDSFSVKSPRPNPNGGKWYIQKENEKSVPIKNKVSGKNAAKIDSVRPKSGG
jgi:hypothetical protein